MVKSPAFILSAIIEVSNEEENNYFRYLVVIFSSTEFFILSSEQIDFHQKN